MSPLSRISGAWFGQLGLPIQTVAPGVACASSSAPSRSAPVPPGVCTPKIEVEYPMGHPKRRRDFLPVVRQKFESSLARRYAPRQKNRILELYDAAAGVDAMPVNEFVEMFVA